MNEIFNYATAPLILTLLLTIIFLSLFIYIKRSNKSKEKITEEFIESIQIMSKGTDERATAKKDPISYWNNLWGNNFKRAGWVSTEMSNERVGFLAGLATFIAYALITLVAQNIGFALVPIVSIYLFIYLLCEKAISDRQEIFDEQVPVFLGLLKTNIKSGETPERALANAIDEVEDPLYSELKNARALIDLGSFQNALSQLRKTTTSDALKFLCGCIELSSKVGTSLENQITIIEDMLESNRILKRKLKTAVAKNTPLLIISAILIPSMFVFMFLTQQQARDFWFKAPISWLAFFAAIGIYLGSVMLSKYIIKKTGEF